jgi:hypothetical protein
MHLAEDAPIIARAIRWISAAYAYLWLLTDAFPTWGASGPVELEIDIGGKPTARSALLRFLYSFPALLLLALLSIASGLFWVIGAVEILVRQRVPVAVADFLAMILCYQARLLGYHLSLVDGCPGSTPLAGPRRDRRLSAGETLPDRRRRPRVPVCRADLLESGDTFLSASHEIGIGQARAAAHAQDPSRRTGADQRGYDVAIEPRATEAALLDVVPALRTRTIP